MDQTALTFDDLSSSFLGTQGVCPHSGRSAAPDTAAPRRQEFYRLFLNK